MDKENNPYTKINTKKEHLEILYGINSIFAETYSYEF
jgi:hypothetical protein